jgi:hypothetical protein
VTFAISAEEYQRFRTLTSGESGIALGDQTQTLVASRLSKRPARVTAGVYDAQEVRDIPQEIMKRHSLHGRGSSDGRLKVKAHLSAMIQWQARWSPT